MPSARSRVLHRRDPEPNRQAPPSQTRHPQIRPRGAREWQDRRRLGLPHLAPVRQGVPTRPANPFLRMLTFLLQVIETESYVNELLGNPKEKETCVPASGSASAALVDHLRFAVSQVSSSTRASCSSSSAASTSDSRSPSRSVAGWTSRRPGEAPRRPRRSAEPASRTTSRSCCARSGTRSWLASTTARAYYLKARFVPELT